MNTVITKSQLLYGKTNQDGKMRLNKNAGLALQTGRDYVEIGPITSGPLHKSRALLQHIAIMSTCSKVTAPFLFLLF